MRTIRVLAVLSAAALCFAVETKVWQQAAMADFEKGSLHKLSLRSDGRLTVSPVVREVFDSSTAFLWALARDSKGNLYAGGGALGGTSAKLFRIDPAGKGEIVTEIEGLAIQAITVDQQDRVYAATSPDGKVYRIQGKKPDVFYDPKAKYIWALSFNSKGELFVATGDQGEIHKVTPAGVGSVFFRTEETHARSLVVDDKDNVIAGTDPGGLILRVNPAGQGFVLYQAGKREITAVAVARDGSIFAAGVGQRQTTSTSPSAPPPVAPQPATPSAAQPPGGTAPSARPAPSPPPTFAPPAAVPGGTEVYRIHPDGSPKRVWTHAQALAYTLSFDAEGRVLVGTGNRGDIYRLDSDRLYTLLASVAPTQITAFCAGPGGRVFAVSGNIGKVFSIGPESETEGSIESELFDSGGFSHWGRLRHEGKGQVTFETRSGNLARAQKNWSAWAPLSAGRSISPAARFVQYRAKLQGSAEVTLVEMAYLPKNVAPSVDAIEMTPSNYRFPAPSNPASNSSPSSLSLPAIGQRRAASAGSSSDGSTPTMNYAKGNTGVRWSASDENGDSLQFKVEIRGTRERDWKLLRDKVRERYYSFDSTAYPDGEYLIRVTATDGPSNTPDQALSSSLEGEPFIIDNTPPVITGLAFTSAGGKVEVRWKARDALAALASAEYSVNGGEWIVVEPTTRLTDSQEHDYLLTVNRASGEMTVAVRVADEFENQIVEKVVVK